jgi:alpha-galactosidase
VALQFWKGDWMRGQSVWRRWMVAHNLPRRAGKLPPCPLYCITNTHLYDYTKTDEANQSLFLDRLAEEGLKPDYWWIDAGWYPNEGGWPNTGTWEPDPKRYPRGLRAVADHANALGVKLLVWLEPERVTPGTWLYREHPEWLLGPEGTRLLNLGAPAAREWLTDHLDRLFTEQGIALFRSDFNIDPLPFWRQNDTPDRQGITEIRYVEGHYEMWDELRARHPGLLIDNCASGGRRIDLETCMRAHPLWRSDTSCSPGHPDWNQAQSWGLSLYLPLHTACGWTPQPYDFRSSATAGAICQWDYLNPDFPVEQARNAMAEARENAPYWYGDFYPLTPCTTTPDHWIAYQFHRPDLDAGLVLAFRRARSPYPAIEMPLHALAEERQYRVELVDDAGKSTVRAQSGKELMSTWELRLPDKGASLVIRYAAAH